MVLGALTVNTPKSDAEILGNKFVTLPSTACKLVKTLLKCVNRIKVPQDIFSCSIFSKPRQGQYYRYKIHSFIYIFSS